MGKAGEKADTIRCLLHQPFLTCFFKLLFASLCCPLEAKSGAAGLASLVQEASPLPSIPSHPPTREAESVRKEI